MNEKKSKTSWQQKNSKNEDRVQKCNYLLPKLKSYSQNDVISYAQLQVKKSAQYHYPTTHLNRQKQSSGNITTNKTQMSKASFQTIKYHYVNKSPNYFKKKNMSTYTVRIDQASYNQPVEDYLQVKMKDFDKKALIDLVNSRIKTISHSNKRLSFPKGDSQQPQPSLIAQSNLQKSQFNIQRLKTYLNSSKFSSIRIQAQANKNKNADKIQKKSESLIRVENKVSKTIDSERILPVRDQQKSLQKKKVQFYETKYSHFEPNRIASLKNNIKNIKKYPSLKLNPHRLY